MPKIFKRPNPILSSGTIPFGTVISPKLVVAMMQALPRTDAVVDYTIGEKAPVKNSDGTLRATARGVTYVAAKVNNKTWATPITHALRFGTQGSMTVPASVELRSMQQFAIEIMVKPGPTTRAKMKLVESQSSPFSLALVKSGNRWLLHGSVYVNHSPRGAAKNQWVGATASQRLSPNRWYCMGLVWDGDDLALLINGKVVVRRVCRNANIGRLKGSLKQKFWVGTWVDGRRDRFAGDIGGLRIWNTVPSKYLPVISHAEAKGMGAIDSRHEDAGGNKGFLGAPRKPEKAERGGRIREYAKGAILWRADLGALIVRDELWKMYKGARPRKSLGFPIKDQQTKSGVKASYFEKGAIYWSKSNGTGTLWGPMYLRYLTLTKVLGLPKGMPFGSTTEPDRRMKFERGWMFYHRNVGAFEVHGSILTRYANFSRDSGILGLPLSDELVVHDASKRDIGRVSRFQNGAIFWSPRTGAFEVHGSILKLYDRIGGPASHLGFPMTNETSVSGSDVRYSGFQNGLIVWRPGVGAKVLTEIEIYLKEIYQKGKIDDGDDSGGEFYTRVNVHVDGKPVSGGNNVRVPKSGNRNGKVTLNKRYKFKVKATTKLYVKVDIWDWDMASDDDYHGRIERSFDIKTLFGTNGKAVEVYTGTPLTYAQKGNTANVNRIRTDFTIGGPAQPVNWNLFRKQAWWRFNNFKTAKLSMSQYVRTFRDVDFIGEWYDVLQNPFDALYYELAFKGAASGGNCFGMSTEALHALHGCSLFPEHIYRFQESQAREIINIKQAYQYGAETVGWSLKNLVNGNMIHPKAVYAAAKREIDRCGACIISTMDLDRGAGHAVLAYKYQDGNLRGSGRTRHGCLYVADPNREWRSADDKNPHPCFLEVRNDNTFVTNYGYASNTVNLVITELPTTLMFMVPWRVVSPQPRTPFWEIILALIALLAIGGLLLFAGDGTTEQVSVGGKKLFRRVGNKRRVTRKIAGMSLVPNYEPSAAAPMMIASDRRIKDLLEIDIKGKRNGRATAMALLGQAMLHVDNPISRSASDKLRVEAGNTAFPVAELTTSQRNKSGRIDYGIVLDPTGRPARRFSFDLPQAKNDPARVSVDPRGGAIVISGGGPSRPIDVEIQVMEGGQIRKGFVRGIKSTSGAEAIRIKPDSWSNPQGTFAVERLSSMGGSVVSRVNVKGKAR